MPNIEKLTENLMKNGFKAVYFETVAEANAYLTKKLSGKSVGFGGSQTVKEMGLYDAVKETGGCVWHWDRENPGSLDEAAKTEAYITSVNGISENGEIVNIDGLCNRVASTLFGHSEVYFVLGVNKIEESLEKAIWRARNIAAPLNARRLGKKTPCAVKADRCYDCQSPDRICAALTVHWKKPGSIARAEVIIINENLGF